MHLYKYSLDNMALLPKLCCKLQQKLHRVTWLFEYVYTRLEEFEAVLHASRMNKLLN
jgi:hypothetical protein